MRVAFINARHPDNARHKNNVQQSQTAVPFALRTATRLDYIEARQVVR